MAAGGDEQKASGSTPAVFISYASLDRAIAESACGALEKAGVTCWIAPRDVTPGAFYPDEIVHAIDAARMIVLILSEHAATSHHVFREVERAASKRHPVLSLRIDKAPLPAGLEYFLNTSQWLDASVGDTERALPKLVSAVQAAIQAPAVTPLSVPTAHSSLPAVSARSPKKIGIIVASVIGLGLLAFAGDRLWVSRQNTAAPPVATSVKPNRAVFSPPPHSIAVLPFVNLSGDKEQEYFSDGLSEELLNDLTRINELQVAGRTSSFYFKGKDVDLATIARKLNVGAVLEGSVRRSAQTLRVTAQLTNAVTGFQLWSQTYDRSLGDVLKLQTDIAEAVAGGLQATLLGDVATRIAVGGTRNSAAYDAYLRASSGYWQVRAAADMQRVISNYREALRLDPHFALAYAGLSFALDADTQYAGPAVQEWLLRAQEPALRAVALAPDLAEGHLALGVFYTDSLDFTRASEELNRALALAPGSARVLKVHGYFDVQMGRSDAGITAVRRAVTLDPLSIANRVQLIGALRLARSYTESLAAYRDALTLAPNNSNLQAEVVKTYYALSDFEAVRSLCEAELKQGDTQGDWPGWLSSAYYKLGRRADSDALLEKVREIWGDAAAVGYAEIYAQRGDTHKALEWLERGLRLHDMDLRDLKVEPLFDPLRNEPRFQAVERELKFPD